MRVGWRLERDYYVNRSLVRLAGAWYSVPCRWAGRDLVARVGASTVTIVGPDGTSVAHPRQRGGQRAIDYRHYLPELAKKPQAVRQVLPELLRDLGDPFPAVWAHLHAAHPDREAARLLAKVLGQIEVHGLAHVATTLTAALAAGTSLLGALLPPVPRATVDVPPALRDLDIGRGCAADYDGWLTEVPA